MGRPREFDVETALARATEVFWERGYEGTSVQDLVEALGVNRASLYGTFGGKAQLFGSVLDRYQGLVSESVGQALEPPAAGADAIRAFFAALIPIATRRSGPRGCLLLNTVTGCVSAPPELQQKVREAIEGTTRRLHAALARDPELARRSDLGALARFFAAEGHGLSVLARAGVPPRELERAAQVALSVLDAGSRQTLSRPLRRARGAPRRRRASRIS